jgi:hypothetical protein
MQQFHHVPNSGVWLVNGSDRFKQLIIAPAGCARLKSQFYGVTSAVSNHETLPDPAREVLDEPRLDAQELEQAIGDSEAWDEASEVTGGDDS